MKAGYLAALMADNLGLYWVVNEVVRLVQQKV